GVRPAHLGQGPTERFVLVGSGDPAGFAGPVVDAPGVAGRPQRDEVVGELDVAQRGRRRRLDPVAQRFEPPAGRLGGGDAVRVYGRRAGRLADADTQPSRIV